MIGCNKIFNDKNNIFVKSKVTVHVLKIEKQDRGFKEFYFISTIL